MERLGQGETAGWSGRKRGWVGWGWEGWGGGWEAGLECPSMTRVIPPDDRDDHRVADYLNNRDAHLRPRHLAPHAPDATGTCMPGGLLLAGARILLSLLVAASL